LSKYQIDKRFIAPLKIQLEYTFEYFNKTQQERLPLLKRNLVTITEKIEKMQERYVIGEIEAGLYQKFKDKFSDEKEAIEAEIEKNDSWSSNLNNYIENALKLISNLHKIWELSDYTAKQKFQKLLFPNGITYHRQNDQVQTSKVNSVLELIQTISTSFNQKENGQPVSHTQLSALVTQEGLTLSFPTKLRFEHRSNKKMLKR